MKKIIIVFALLVFAAPAMAQTMYPIETGIFAWDAVSKPNCTCPSPPCTPNVSCPGPTYPSPAAGIMKYQAWSKSTAPATTGTKVGGEITATQLNMTFPPYSAVYPGAQAVFYPAGNPTVASTSTIAWSTDPAACAGGVTFGILFSPTIDAIRNLRMQ